MKADGLVDLQVNGFAGVDFNDPAVTPDQIHAAAHKLREAGIAHILATVITAHPEPMMTCLQTLVQARETDALTREVIFGLHVEGPFLQPEPGYIGAHPADAALPADRDLAARLLEAGGGLVRLFTLAPECDPDGQVTRFLADQGIRVAAGHTNASLDALRIGIDNGLTMFTHLGNGCPLQMHRHDNIIQRALSFRAHLHYGLIADGIHLPPFVLRNCIDLAGLDHCFIVSDCTAAAGLGPGRYTLGDHVVEVDESGAAWGEGRAYFVGSAVSLRRCTEVLSEMGFSKDDIRTLVRDNPLRCARPEPR